MAGWPPHRAQEATQVLTYEEVAQTTRRLKQDGLGLYRPAPPSAKGRVQGAQEVMEDGARDTCQGAGDQASSYST